MSGNELRWSCENQGCFNKKKRPKINIFHECFGCGINFGDVDGIVERKGNFLMLEWKSPGASTGIGQRILHDKLCELSQFTVLLVSGDAELMTVNEFTIRRLDKSKKVVGGIEDLKKQISQWYEWADR